MYIITLTFCLEIKTVNTKNVTCKLKPLMILNTKILIKTIYLVIYRLEVQETLYENRQDYLQGLL